MQHPIPHAPAAPQREPGQADGAAPDLAALANGDLAALLLLYDRYAALVYALALRVVGEPARAQKAVELTFLSIRRQASLYHQGLGPPHGWIAQIAYGHALALLRNSASPATD